jgi:hypothetical protein
MSRATPLYKLTIVATQGWGLGAARRAEHWTPCLGRVGYITPSPSWQQHGVSSLSPPMDLWRRPASVCLPCNLGSALGTATRSPPPPPSAWTPLAPVCHKKWDATTCFVPPFLPFFSPPKSSLSTPPIVFQTGVLLSAQAQKPMN